MAAPALLLLRLTIAAVLAAHGAHRLFGVFGGPGVGPGGLSHTATYFASLGIGQSFAAAVVAGAIQLVGGLFLAVGFGARVTSAVVLVLVGVEVWKDQLRWGFFLNWTLDPARGHGIEFSLVMVAVLVTIVLAGPGDWSFDGRRARRSASRAAGRARLRRH